MMTLHNRARWIVLFCVASLPARAPAEVPNDQAIDAAIQAGVSALLNRINPLDEIEYQTGDPGPAPQPTQRVSGTIVKIANGFIRIRTADGKILSIPQNRVVQRITRGHIRPELNSHFLGGHSALAALALVVAGVETTNPKLALLLDALAADDAPTAGTYVHSLRAATWSALLERPIGRAARQRYHKLLTAELKWLTKAMHPDGGYGYTQTSGGGWDHSNTQFGNLGLWAAGVAKLEVDNHAWQLIAHHWLETQHDTGGWSYRRETVLPTSSMTLAGCNSLYIVLDQLYARSGGVYRLFEGIRPDKKNEEPIRRIRAAIDRGDDFLRKNPPNPESFAGYELFGLERLGVASGQSIIGGADWYRNYVGLAGDRRWGENPVAEAFAVIFLVHGQAPVLIQRMVYGDQDTEPGYYFRDIANLTRYLSRAFERLHRWQRIPVNTELRELEDAPILYIGGRKSLELPDIALKRIRRYLDDGGTVFLHADGSSKKFIDSATDLFERMFNDRGYRFEPLVDSHPVYHCHFGMEASSWKQRCPLRGLSDGSRVMVFLCPVDIAGAWHQDRAGFEDLFKIMANVRVYAAPPYAQLPRRLRPTELPGPPAPSAGPLRLVRFPYKGNWDAHPEAWNHFLPGLRHRTGIDLITQPQPQSLDAGALANVDVVHLSLQKRANLDRAATSLLKEYLEGGGLLLIDAADGQPAAIQAVSAALDQPDIGTRGILPSDHPIVRGSFPGGKPLTHLEATEAGAGLTRGDAPPPIFTRTINGRIAVLACPFDLVAGLSGHFIWNCSGYQRESTARIVDNILLWRLHSKSNPTTPSKSR